MLISIETYRTCDFPEGRSGPPTPPPPSPLDPRMDMIDPLTTSKFASPVKPRSNIQCILLRGKANPEGQVFSCGLLQKYDEVHDSGCFIWFYI